MNKIPVVVLVGPTASGKTSLAVKLCQACNGEVVSGDSMQIYRGMDIGTAKPTEEEKGGIPHHLLDIADVSENYSVARFCADAAEAVADVHDRNKLPVIAGGTGLYIDSFLQNTPFAEQGDVTDLRASLREEYDRDGGESLYREITEKDPEAAAKIHPHNAVRVIRAVELLRSGQTLSGQIARTKETESPYRALRLFLDFENRQTLYDRIDRRVDAMMESGLVDEAKRLYDRRDTLGKTAKAAIGYKELFSYFDGECTLSEATERIKAATRHYAKRQLTWFRRDRTAVRLEASLPIEENLKKAQELTKNLLFL